MMEKTLSALLTERVTQFAQSPKAIEIIDKGVENLFQSVINDCFRSYSDMGKLVEEAVKSALPGNISDLFELKRYNALITESMRQTWESSGIEVDMQRRMTELLSETLEKNDLPKEIHLSALMEAFIKDHREEAAENGWEAPKVIFEKSHGFSDSSYYHLYFDKAPDENSSWSRERSKYQLECSLAMYCNDKDKISIEEHHRTETYDVGHVYSATLDGKSAFAHIGRATEFERMVLALYFGSSRIIIDCDPDDISYPGYDD